MADRVEGKELNEQARARNRAAVVTGSQAESDYQNCERRQLPLLIIGCGELGQAVARLAAELDFEISVLDDRPDKLAKALLPQSTKRIAGSIGEVLPGLDIASETYCLILTRNYDRDREALFHLAERQARYVGMIGNQRKIQDVFEELFARGISAQALAKVHAPIGINIGSRTVPEIAISIAAELIAARSAASAAENAALDNR